MNRFIKVLCAMLAAWTSSGLLASAYAVTLMPLTLVMEHDKTVVILHVRNDELQAAIFEVQTFRWSQDGGKDVLEPTNDLIVTPPIMKLAPGEDRIVRIGVMQRNPGRTQEMAYRLLLRDITPIESPARGLHLQMQYLLPLFISPGLPRNDVQLLDAAVLDGAGCIQIINTGNVHAKLVWTAPESAPGSAAPTQKYVLAGGQALHCSLQRATDGGKLIAGVTSAYQNEVTSYEVLPSRN